MKKIILIFFCFLIGNIAAYSGDFSYENTRFAHGRGSTLETQPYFGRYQDYNHFSSPFLPDDFSFNDTLDKNTYLERGRGNTLVKAKNIEETQQYFGLPQVPLVHHYNNFSPPLVLYALKGKIPQGIIRNVPEVALLMKAVGVKESDPGLMVVQGFSGVFAADGFSLDPAPKAPLLLRPMYYFSQNKAFDSKTQYTENINIKAAIFGINSALSITPDKENAPHDFGISVHNSGPNTPIVSSGNNMAISGLCYNKSTAFLGVYKGVSRTVTGAVKDTTLADDRGVAVLHVLLDENDRDEFINQINNGSTAEDLSKIISPLFKYNPSSQPAVITTPMVEEKEKRPQIAPQKKPQAPVAKVPVTAPKVVRKAPIVHQKSVATAPKTTPTAAHNVAPTPKAPTAVHKVATARRTTSTAVHTVATAPKAPTAVHKVATARRTTTTAARNVAPAPKGTTTAVRKPKAPTAARNVATARRTTSTAARTSSASARRAAIARQRLAARGAAIARQRLLAARGAAVTRQRSVAARGAAVTRQRPAVRKAPVVRKKVVTARRAAVARSRR